MTSHISNDMDAKTIMWTSKLPDDFIASQKTIYLHIGKPLSPSLMNRFSMNLITAVVLYVSSSLAAILAGPHAHAGSGHAGDSLNIRVRQDTIAESKIISERIAAEAKTQTGHKRLDRLDFIHGNVVFSSPDIIKTLQNLPGVNAGTEMMSGLYVHGGEGSDNLFLLDGVPMYQVSHMGGLFSSFNTDVIEGLDFYKSGFPARYGGRMSSVVDVSTRDGDFEEFHGSFMIGLIDGRLQFEGPIVKGKTSFNIALRRSWMDAVLVPTVAYLNSRDDSGETIEGSYAFHDLNASITHRFSDRDRLSLRMYYGRDRLRLGMTTPESVSYRTDKDTEMSAYGEDEIRSDIAWGNILASLNWNHSINEDMHLRATAYYSGSDADVRYGWKDWSFEYIEHYDSIDETNISKVSDIAAFTDIDWRPDRNNHLKFGASYQHHMYAPSRHSILDNDGAETETISGKGYSGNELAFYAEDEISIADRLNINTGLRYVIFSVPGRTRHRLEPRMAVSFRCSDNVDIKASYTHMNQFAHLISTNYLDVPTNCWLPSTADIEPMHSKQAAAGIYTRLPLDFRLNVEAYYKTMDNLLEYSGANSLFPPLDSWERSFHKGKGRAYGIEAEFGWESSRLSFTAYYTLSWSKRKFDGIWHDWYPHRHDNRHKLTLMGSWKITDRIDLYANWNYNSGGWMTVPTHIYNPGYVFDRIYTAPNNVNLPDYHRLDIGADFRRTTRRGNESIWNIGIYNAYCRKNVVFVAISERDDKSLYGEGRAIFPIIPSFSYTLRF